MLTSGSRVGRSRARPRSASVGRARRRRRGLRNAPCRALDLEVAGAAWLIWLLRHNFRLSQSCYRLRQATLSFGCFGCQEIVTSGDRRYRWMSPTYGTRRLRPPLLPPFLRLGLRVPPTAIAWPAPALRFARPMRGSVPLERHQHLEEGERTAPAYASSLEGLAMCLACGVISHASGGEDIETR